MDDDYTLGIEIMTGSRFIKSYGAFDTIFRFLQDLEVLSFQSLNRFMYTRGVARAQMSYKLCTPAFFTKGCAKLKDKMFSYHARAKTAKRLKIDGMDL